MTRLEQQNPKGQVDSCEHACVLMRIQIRLRTATIIQGDSAGLSSKLSFRERSIHTVSDG